MSANIQQVSRKDLVHILILQKKAFTEVAKLMNRFNLPPLLQTIEDLYNEHENSIILKYTSDSNKIVGSVRGFVDANNICQIRKLVVNPLFQNKGIGQSLMLEIEKYFPSCSKYVLFTGDGTLNTLHLYKKIGYGVSEEKDLDGISMLFMEKENTVNK